MRTGSDCLLLLSDALELGLGLASDGSLFLGACVGVERVDGRASCLVLVEIILKLPLLVQRWTNVVSFGHRACHERRGGDGGRRRGEVCGRGQKAASSKTRSKQGGKPPPGPCPWPVLARRVCPCPSRIPTGRRRELREIMVAVLFTQLNK